MAQMAVTDAGTLAPQTPAEIVNALLHDEPLALDNPYALYAALREQAPVYQAENGMWVLTRYDDISKALRHRGMSMMAALRADPRYASSATLQTSAESMLFFDDPADHGRQRRLVSQAFTNRTVTELRPWVQALVDRLLEDCLSRPVFDFMGDFADQIPVAVICHLLGVPDRDIDTFKDWNFTITATTGADRSDEQVAEADRATTNLLGYLNDLLETRAKALEDDLISRLITARDEEDRLSRDETTGLAFLLLVAGSDTTSAFLGGAMAALLRAPEQLNLLRADRGLMPNALEELMRYEAPVHFGIMRTTTEPLVLDDVEIGPGQRVWTITSGGNRDPERFPNPGVLDLTRSEPRHLGFGFGMHSCLGAVLARMESTVALSSLLDRTRDLTLAQEQIPWIDHGNLRTIGRLDVAVTRP
jgi:cytochrome P450